MTMEAPVSVSAGWALWGKQAGSNSDYSVLASSAEPLSPAEFGSVLAHFAPGTPPTEDNLPGSLPWVVISRVGIEGRSYIGIAIQRSGKDVDSVGRPITMTSYFCVPFAELADPPVSYTDLYRQLDSVELPGPGDDPIRLSIPRMDPAAVAASISDQNWEPAVSAAAAMLLNGPVSIIGSEGSTMEERLLFLDAVAALLPFRYRADFTASTWSDSAARHQIRLAFAARAREGAGTVQWRFSAVSPPASGSGGSYFRLLRDIRGHRTGTGGLADLIGALARDATAGDFAQPQDAVTTLRQFDLPFIVVGAVRDGTAQPADIRAVFASERVAELDFEDRQALLDALIGLGDPQDMPAIRAWWDTVFGAGSAAAVPALVQTCRRLLWSQTPSRAVSDYLTLAAGYGLLDAVLADVTALPESAAGQSGGVQAAAQLLADWALGDPYPDFPLTRRSLAANPIVVSELMAQLAGSAGTRAALTWLEPAMDDFLRPFSVVLGDSPGTVDQFQLDQLARYSIGCSGALLQAAFHSGRLNRMLPAFSSWLAVRDLGPRAGEPAETRFWYEHCWAINVADTESQAWLDLALLASRNQPRYLLNTVYGPTCRDYCEILAVAWSELVTSVGQAADDPLTDRLIGYLEETRWTADPLKVDTVVLLAGLLTRDGYREHLASAVTNALLDNPEAARRGPGSEWLSRFRSDYQDPRTGDVLALIRQHRANLTEDDLADLCARGCREGVNPEDVGRALAEAAAIHSGWAALDLLDQVRASTYQVQTQGLEPHEWLKSLATFIASGNLGDRIADELRQAALRAAHDDFVFRLDMLYIAVTKGRPDSQPELTSDDLRFLEWIPKSVDSILRQARRRPGRLPFRGGKRDRDESDEPSGQDSEAQPESS
jgi:hypothetical protein